VAFKRLLVFEIPQTEFFEEKINRREKCVDSLTRKSSLTSKQNKIVGIVVHLAF